MTQHFGEDHLNWKQRVALILTITAYVSVPILVFMGVLK